MKQAYVSIVLNLKNKIVSLSELSRIDYLLSLETRRHEIILVHSEDSTHHDFRSLSLLGPLTSVRTQENISRNDALLAGLGRSVGDFVIEWSLETPELNEMILHNLLTQTDSGAEVIEGLFQKTMWVSRCFYWVANKLRPANAPLRKSAVRLFSRRALNWILEANHFESEYPILVAELPFQRRLQVLAINPNYDQGFLMKVRESLGVLIKGSRFGTVVPLVLAGASSLFALAVAVYAMLVFVFSGTAADGWTSIAVVTGLGQGAILALIGMVWARLDNLSRGLSRRIDSTVYVEVFPAKL